MASRRTRLHGAVVRVHRDERGQTLPIVLSLITFLFLVGGALALHASTALRATVANEGQADDLHAADAGMELGIWWHRAGNAGDPPAITVNGKSVASTVSVAAGPCDTSTPIRLTGFEHGAISATGGGLFTAVTGAGATADATVSRSGTYSLRMTDAAASANSVSWSVSGGVLVARFYIRFGSLPAGNVNEVASVDAAAGSDLLLGYASATQRLTLRYGAGAAVSASSAVVAGTWHRLDVRATLNANPRTANWQLDGSGQTAVSSSEATSTGSNVRLGSTVVADTYTANYDDVVVSSTSADYPLGDGSVFGLRPGGNGTHSSPGDFRNDDSSAIDATTWQRVDDLPMTSTAQWVEQRTTNTTGYIELTVADTAQTCLSGVAGILQYTAAGGGTRHGKTSVFDGATERVIYDGDMSAVGPDYRAAIVAPSGGGWTTAEINALRVRFGYSNDANPDVEWDAILLEVASGSSAPGTVTVTASAGGSTVTTTYLESGAAPPSLATWTTTR